MLALDLRTIVFTNVLTSMVCILVVWFLWRQSRNRFEGMGYWVWDFALQTIALLLIILRGNIPDFLSMVISNTAALTGALLGYMGLECFVGKKGRQIHNYGLIVVFFLVHTYFALFQPSLWARNLNISSALLIICFQCAWLLLRKVEPGLRPLTRGVGIVFTVYCLVSIIRIVKYFISPAGTWDYLHAGYFEALVLVTYQILFIILAYSLILMVNKRLHGEVTTQEEKFSKAFHSSPYAITLTRLPDGLIEEVNNAFFKMTGYVPEEVLGKTTVELNLWYADGDRINTVDELTRNSRVEGRELRFRAKNGELIEGLFSAAIIPINGQGYVLSSIGNITARKRAEQEREKLIAELQTALAEVKTLRGFIPICSNCKKIRDDEGFWQQIEKYVQDRSDAQFSHGICPECMKKLYPDFDTDE